MQIQPQLMNMQGVETKLREAQLSLLNLADEDE